MKKGFTLIELLAVIVILAIIALIATPIILGIIEEARNEAKVRSAELYLTAIEQAIMRKKMNDIAFNPSACVIEANNILNCGTGNIQIDVDANDITSGYVMLNNGKIDKYNLEIDGEDQANVEETSVDCFAYERYFEYTVDVDKCSMLFLDRYDDDYFCNTYTEFIEEASMNYGLTVEELEQLEIINISKRKATITEYLCAEKDVVIPRKIEGNLVTEIGGYAFSQKELTSVIIPSSVTNIAFAAFESNNLESVIIQNGVNYIENCSFQYNKLTNIVIPNDVKYIGIEAFNQNQLTSIIIPSSVTTIGEYAFGNNNLNSVVIQNKKENVEFITYTEEKQSPFYPFNINNIKWEPVE